MTDAGINLGLTVQLNLDFEQAEQRVIEALKAEGFGVLTEIDVKATLKKKLDANFRPYKILGACNPPLAYRALSAASQIGLMLPCNVTLSQIDENHVEVSLVDPISMMSVVNMPELEAVASEARERLERVAASLEE